MGTTKIRGGTQVIDSTITTDDLDFSVPTDFTDLGDVPAAYTGGGGKLVAVNAGEDALIFVASGVYPTTFVGLGDVPTNYTAASGVLLRVNDTETGLVFSNIISGALTADGAITAGGTMYIDGAVGTHRQLFYTSGGLGRWAFRVNNAAESGSDVGSDFEIISRADNGDYLATPMKIWRASGVISIGGASDFYSIPWTDYSGTSAILGWTSYTTKKIYYKKIGKLVYVTFFIEGTSDNTATTFTLPFTSGAGTYTSFAIQAKDNGTYSAAGLGQLAHASATIVFYGTMGGAAWTALGSKRISGQFFYETA